MRESTDLDEFCRREHARLVGMLSLYVGDRMVGEELAQEALARACRDWRKVRSLDRPEAWVQRVAINLANSSFRRKAAEKRAKSRLESRAPVTNAEPDAADAVAVRTAVAALPRRQRTVLVLHYYADLPFVQVAEILGCPEPTAKSLARRAILKLRDEAGLVDLKEATDAI